MRRISIIGAGWLGFPLGKVLVAKSKEVKGSSTRVEKLAAMQSAGIQGIHLSFEPEAKGNLLAALQADVLVLTIPPRKNEEFYSAVLQSILQEMQHSPVQKVIYTSATSVYPDCEAEVSEDDAQVIVSRHSGVRLLTLEKLLRQKLGDDLTILRLGGLYGPGRQPCRFLAGKTEVPGGDNPVNMVHLQDCIRAIECVLEQNAWGRTYNVVNPDHLSRKEFYARACALSGAQAPSWGSGQRPWKKVSSALIMKELGFSFLPHFPEA